MALFSDVSYGVVGGGGSTKLLYTNIIIYRAMFSFGRRWLLSHPSSPASSPSSTSVVVAVAAGLLSAVC